MHDEDAIAVLLGLARSMDKDAIPLDIYEASLVPPFPENLGNVCFGFIGHGKAFYVWANTPFAQG